MVLIQDLFARCHNGRNMLPFEFSQLILYRLFTTFRLLILRLLQSRSFMSADGVIFLSVYASSSVQTITGNLPGLISVIPHGINSFFLLKDHYDIKYYTPSNPFRLIYVSIVDFYKYQWNVVYAISASFKYNWLPQLDLVGPSNPSAMKRPHNLSSQPIEHVLGSTIMVR